MLRFKGQDMFRWRVGASLLRNIPIKISHIREHDSDGQLGINDDEHCFLRLVCDSGLTHGSELEINDTGTIVTIQKPGIIVGGAGKNNGIVIDCSACRRSVGYLIEGVIPLCLFAKKPVTEITFTNCITDENFIEKEGSSSPLQQDLSADAIREATVRIVQAFLKSSDLSIEAQLTINKRGAAPSATGEVVLRIPSARRTLSPINWTDPGVVQSVRGVAYSLRVSPQFANRMVDGARSVLNDFLSDIYIHTAASKGGPDSSPGYGISLIAETSTKSLLTFSATNISKIVVSQAQDANEQNDEDEETHGKKRKREDSEKPSKPLKRPANATVRATPEEIGQHAATGLCEEISRGGVVDSSHQPLILLLMALASEDVSKIRLGKLTPFTIAFLRFIKEAYGVMFKIVPENESSTVLLSCMGTGLCNISKKVA